jgi:hypothetical protein
MRKSNIKIILVDKNGAPVDTYLVRTARLLRKYMEHPTSLMTKHGAARARVYKRGKFVRSLNIA